MAKKPTYEDLEQRVRKLERRAISDEGVEVQVRESEQQYRDLYENAPTACFSVSAADGSILRCNFAAAGLLGYDKESMIGKRILDFYADTPDGKPMAQKVFSEFRAGKSIKAVELQMEHKNGEPIWINLYVEPVRDHNGKIIESRSVAIDITERKRMEQVLLESEEKYRSMMEAMSDPVYICSPDYRVEYMNPAMIRRAGGNRTGEPCYKAIHGLDEECPWCVHEHVQQGNPTETSVVSPKDGRSYLVSHSPVFHADGSVSKMTIFRDVTELKRAEAALRKARDELEQRVEERTAELIELNEQLKRQINERKRIEEALRKDRSSLAEAQRIARLGNWDWNIATNELQWSDEIYRIFGLAPQEFGATYEAFLNSVHPDDRQYVKRAVNEALHDHKPYSIHHRIVLPDGTERIVHEQAVVDLNNDGKPVRMFGTVHDITERKQAEEALEQSEAQLRRLSAQLLEVQENERKRIARELHDSIGQSLTAVKFGLEIALSRMSQNAVKTGVESLEALIPVVQQASEEVRQIHTDLRPSLLDDLGIISTISWFCREFEKLYTGIQLEKQIEIEEEEVPEPLKTVIFRVLQEALNNISKHGKADRVLISLKRTDKEIEFVVKDNGQGFDMKRVHYAKSPREGFGLSSMKERTELSGGAFAIESTPGVGTAVRASWPV